MKHSYKSFSVEDLPKKEIELENADFKHWSAAYAYRTSYRDMSRKSQSPPKKYVIPGYKGYIPSAEESLGKSLTLCSKEQFNREKYLDAPPTENFPQRPVTSGTTFLGKFGGGIPDEYHSISRLYGKSTIPVSHPSYAKNDWKTSSAIVHIEQEPQRRRIFRTTKIDEWKQTKPRQRTMSSGFVENSTLLDGIGWTPMAHLHGDMKKTEYRNRFNMYVNFHPRPHKANARRLARKTLVY